MKSTGIVRNIDELGRIVLPVEMRRTLEIAERDPLEIYVDGENIILKKYEPELKSKKEKKYICAMCQREIDPSEIENHTAVPVSAIRRTRARKPKSKDEE